MRPAIVKKGTVLSTLDILTTASANADVTAAIKTLPGAQQVGESEGLFVRGGTAAETKIYIDGTLVNNFFYSSVPDIAQRGRFLLLFLKALYLVLEDIQHYMDRHCPLH